MSTLSETFQSSQDEYRGSTLERLLREVHDRLRRESLRRELERERRQLLEMSDAMLADLGISHGEARAEARRTDIPADRLRLVKRSRRD